MWHVRRLASRQHAAARQAERRADDARVACGENPLTPTVKVKNIRENHGKKSWENHGKTTVVKLKPEMITTYFCDYNGVIHKWGLFHWLRSSLSVHNCRDPRGRMEYHLDEPQANARIDATTRNVNAKKSQINIYNLYIYLSIYLENCKLSIYQLSIHLAIYLSSYLSI